MANMETQANINYGRVAKAIEYIRQHFRSQPGLEEVAEAVHVSPAHFQRLFTEWAGTSPKKFLQYISIEHAKKILAASPATLADTSFETGFSSASRLHDLFVKIEGMTPAEYKNGGKYLRINYSFAESPFGALIIASTSKGVCHMAFENDDVKAFRDLQQKFPQATFQQKTDLFQQEALFIFRQSDRLPEIKLHLKGTGFQLKVWESLLKIPMGRLSTYGAIALQVGRPSAARAVGTAIGSNPVAFLIPCHRVIQSSGSFGGYMWGANRKAAIIGWEGAQTEKKNLLPYDGMVQYYGKLLDQAEANDYFDILMKTIDWRNDEAIMFGKRIVTKRKVAWYGEKPFEYTYSNVTKYALPFTSELQALRSLAETATGETYNSCLLNLYHDGTEGMAWHSDGEPDLKKDGAIASLSFGAERKFAFKHKQSGEKIELQLAHGSLLVMKGKTQACWLHRLPPSRLVKAPRINLTFRTIISD